MYIYIHTCLYVYCLYIFLYSRIYLYVYMCMYMYMYMHTRTHIYIHMYLCMQVCVCVHIFVYTCMFLSPFRESHRDHLQCTEDFCRKCQGHRSTGIPAKDADWEQLVHLVKSILAVDSHTYTYTYTYTYVFTAMCHLTPSNKLDKVGTGYGIDKYCVYIHCYVYIYIYNNVARFRHI